MPRPYMSARRLWSVAIFLFAGPASLAHGAEQYFVSTSGSDANPGTHELPFASLDHARQIISQRTDRSQPVTVLLAGGTYYLPDTLVFQAADSGTKDAPITYAAIPGQTPVISGGQKLELTWKPYKNGIMQAAVPAGTTADQLFVNGERQSMARYPNYDPKAAQFNGTAADAFSAARAARWADPMGGFMHAMHPSLWGDMHYQITGKDAQGNLTFVGGWQNNRPAQPHRQFRFVENIFEELDAPGEWFLNAKTNTLYIYPPAGVTLESATVESVHLRHLVEFRGTQKEPVRFITLQGLTFRHAAVEAGEVSAFGLAGEAGVIVVQAPAGSSAAKAGLQERDVILKCQGRDLGGVEDLLKSFGNAAKGTTLALEVWRLQRVVSVDVTIE